MRILMITSSYEPLSGGAETYARLLCHGLATLGHHVTIVTDGSWVDSLPVMREESGVRVLRLRTFAKHLDARDKVRWREMYYSVLSELGEFLGSEQFDVVHANSHEALLLGSIVALSCNAALVASLHEQNPDKESYGIGRCRLSYQVLPVSVYITASQFYKQRALEFGVPPERIRLIYHGVPDVKPEEGEVKRFREGISSNPKTRLLVLPGRIYARKAQSDMVRALPMILNHHPETILLLAGRVSDFVYEAAMWELAEKLKVRSKIVLRQDFSAMDMLVVLSAADVVVQPSLEEGLGLATIEAMAMGKPVVATKVIGLSEVISDQVDGLLVPVSSPDLLALAVNRCLADKQLSKQLAADALSTVQERFSVDAMVVATVEAYNFAISEKSMV